MKITVMNAYTWFNKGDAGILMGTLQEINDVVKEAHEINILSFTPDTDATHYKKIKNVKGVYSNLLNPYPFKKNMIGKSMAIIKLGLQCVFQLVFFFLFRPIALRMMKSLKVLNQSDIIIVCGGGFLGGKKFNSLIHLHQIFIATFLNKKVFLWGTSIEPPTNNTIKKLTEMVIGRLDHVYSREAITTRYLKTFLPSEKYSFTPDLAFMVPKVTSNDVKSILKSLPKDRTLIGITVRHWHFPKSVDKIAALKQYTLSIASMITEFTKNRNSTFVFIPQVIFDGDDDRMICREIREMLPQEIRHHFIILEQDLSPSEIKDLISNLYIFVGTRMHSNIFATGALIPTVAIAYESKTNGIMNMLELDNYVIDIEDVTPSNLIERVTQCYSLREELSQHLSVKIPQIQTQIRQKSVFLIDRGEKENEHYNTLVAGAN